MRILLALGGIALFAVVLLAGSYISAHNGANAHEQGIIAADRESEVTLGQYGQTIQELAQIPSMQTEDLVAIITAANDARYGDDGVAGVMTWITEQNPTLNQETYLQLQREIAAGRAAFTRTQSVLTDRVRAYETDLGTFWRGRWMAIAGWPKINTEDYRAVTTQSANDAFQTRTDGPALQLR